MYLSHQNGKGVVAGEAVEERRRAESSKLVVPDDLKKAYVIGGPVPFEWYIHFPLVIRASHQMDI